MNALHQAVARALYDDRVWDDTREVPWEEADDFQRSFFLEQAAAAIGVCFAEATRIVREYPLNICGYGAPMPADHAAAVEQFREAVLAALGEQA